MQKLEINTVALGMKIDVKLLGLIWGLLIVYFLFYLWQNILKESSWLSGRMSRGKPP
jgi:dolichyl-phosphate-mannose--protein O-mannosyl transferase